MNLTDGTARGGDAQVTIDGVTLYDTLIGIEDLEGSDEADELTGNGVTNYLAGHDGNDTLKGEGGNDELEGGLGQDTLHGGTGADTFVFDEADVSTVAAPDVVKDFSGLGADSGAGRVWYSHRAGDTTDDVTTNDRLTDVFVDLDGNGRADFQVTLEGATDITLTAADFLGVEAAIA